MTNRFIVLFTVTFLFFITPVPVNAQNTEKEPLYFQTYTIEDGLPDNWIRDVTQDQQGYIWIATASGVSKFDGYGFENFLNEPGNASSLSGNDAINVLVDKQNQIWVGTDLGLNRFNRATRTFQHFKNDPNDSTSLPGNVILKLHESRTGTLWVLTNQGLAAFEPNSQTFKVFSTHTSNENQSSPANLTSITESSDGRIWIGTVGEGIKILNPDTREITSLRNDPEDKNSLPSDFIRNLFIDREEILWVNYNPNGTGSIDLSAETGPDNSPTGLWKKNLSTGDVYHYLYNPELGHLLFGNLMDFEQTKDGKLWFSRNNGISGGLYGFNDQNNNFDKYIYEVNNPGTIAWNFATAVYEDCFSNLWVATSRGLSRVNRSQIRMNSFTPNAENKYDPVNNFYGITEMSENRFWISPDGGNEIIDWNRNTNTWEVLTKFKLDVLRLPVLPDDANNIWGGYWPNSIQRLNMQTLEKTSFELNGSAYGVNYINHFILLQDGDLLVATDNGLWKLEIGSGRFLKVELATPFVNNAKLDIQHLTSEPTGNIWLVINNATLNSSGSESGILLASYDPETGLTKFPDIDEAYMKNFGNGSANYISLDSHGNVWISKTNGLVRFNPESNEITTYNQDNGLRHIIVLGSLEDDDGMIWIVTNYGISRLNPSTGAIRNFGSSDGLRPVRMNNYSFLKRKNGELMFGGVGGLSYFDPEDIRESEDPPLISLVRLESGDATVNLSGAAAAQASVDIDWGANSVNLEFVSVNFRNPGETTYSYKLEGFHNDWVDAGTRRFAQFSNLPPKNYTFHVKAVNADGLTSTHAALVSFRVLPPWWRTWWAYGFYLMLFIAAIVAADRIQRRRVQQKERERAREKELAQAKEIEKAYQNLEVAHANLKSTQSQLIQSEKMASLGELTAGIAHEIQNPLNFVNNFSEVSNELIDEMKDELAEGSRRLAVGSWQTAEEKMKLAEEIANYISQNLEKVNHHGKRADAIVKGMLQHSRTYSGQKEPTDINALADEYLRLSYHGLRAKDKSFNNDFKTDFDDSMPKINVIPQDIGRVLLNLINNAFYAVNARKLTAVGTTHALSLKPPTPYTPTVTVSTKNIGDRIEISVKDNGPGIPEDIKDKIFQPFFTTKPTGQGTGLGLSLSYDIVKAHGGELTVETREGEGSELIIQIPIF